MDIIGMILTVFGWMYVSVGVFMLMFLVLGIPFVLLHTIVRRYSRGQ